MTGRIKQIEQMAGLDRLIIGGMGHNDPLAGLWVDMLLL